MLASLSLCEALHARARAAWGGRFLARPIDRRLAAGTQATSESDYTPGHDFRYVDWNRCARLDELVTRRFEGREDHHVHLLVDVSASMSAGGSAKADYARRVAALLAYLALANGDALSLAAFGARIIAATPPLAGKTRLPQAWGFLERLETAAGTTDFARVAADFLARPLRRGLVVIVSDFLAPDAIEAGVETIRRRGYLPHLVQIYDPRDAEPDTQGGVTLTDAETGETLTEELTADDLAHYREVWGEFMAGLRGYCRKYGVGLTQTSLRVPPEGCLDQMMHAAAWRR